MGAEVLSDSLDTKCKCHGVSGSCSVKTCWKGLPNLDEIASDLKSKYLAAIKVTHRLVGSRKQLIPKEMDVRPVKETDLVYLINSPDYCTPNLHLGSLGTQDRLVRSAGLDEAPRDQEPEQGGRHQTMDPEGINPALGPKG
ncbi:protein wnt- hypothetical protein [Limosa lapponica baueri]|uniref:Protein Wnt n=1 Tax=Limosa lapponica baueri TaxID=1758121 RepID=A0A2I0T684_LIMLA|nr:protein wnt- hypothetical protein [Limosa lapponica baueri]